MTKKCEECGSYDLKADGIRGEVVCNDCGLVVEDQASATQNDNAGAMWGENASNTPTKDESKIKTGSKGNARLVPTSADRMKPKASGKSYDTCMLGM